MKNILFEVSPIDPATGNPITLRMCAAWAKDSKSSVVNDVLWLPIIEEGPRISFSVFENGETAPATVSYSDITILLDRKKNIEGWSNYYWDGAAGKVWIGEMGAAFGSYTQIFNGTVGPLSERQGQRTRISLLGSEAKLNTDLLTGTYGGTGGLEGTSELLGNFKPWASGFCQNVDPVLIDPINWIYQVHGYGPINDITAIYENALEVDTPSESDAANYAALVGLALLPGQWATCLSSGLFRLGAEPKYKITADVEGSLEGATFNSTVGSIAQQLIKWAGVDSGDIETSTFTPFNQTSSLYARSQITVMDAVKEVFGPAGYFFASNNGKWKAGSVFNLKTPTPLHYGEFRTLPKVIEPKQLAASPPVYRVRVGGDRCWSTHSDGEISQALTDGAQDAITGFLTNESQNLAASSAGVVSSFALAVGEFKVFDGLDDVSTLGGVLYELGSQTGCTAYIDASTGAYSVSAMSADTASAIFTATYGTVVIAKTFSLAKSKAGTNGTTGADAKTLTLLSDRQTIAYDAAGAASPSTQTTTFSVNKQNTTATVNWTLTDAAGVSRTASTYLSATTGDSVTMTESQFAGARNGTTGVIVIATITDGSTISDKISVVRVQAGAPGTNGTNGTSALYGVLTNSTHTVPATSAGVVSSFSGAGGTFRVYLGTTEVTSTTAYSVFNQTNVVVSINSTTGVYTVTSMSADSGTATFRATYSGNTIDLVYTISKSKAGTDGSPAKTLSITPTGNVIYLNEAGDAATPSTQPISWTANKVNTSASVTWTLFDLAGTSRAVGTYLSPSSGDTVTISAANFLTARGSTNGVRIVATLTDGVTLTDSESVIGVQKGATGVAGVSSAQVLIYRRAASSPTLPSASTTYTFATGVLTGLNNSWTQAVPASDGNPLWVSASTASGSGSTDTIASGEWATPVLHTTDGATGAAGVNTASVELYQRNGTGTAPSVPASTLTYTFASAGLSGTLGSWTRAVPAASGGKYLFKTQATALGTGTTDTIATGEWSSPVIIVENGDDGIDGSNAFAVVTTAGVTYETNSLRCPTSLGWSAQGAYSVDSMTGGCLLSYKSPRTYSTTEQFMVALNADASASHHYTDLDHAFYHYYSGGVHYIAVYESGTQKTLSDAGGTSKASVSGATYGIRYENGWVFYYENGTIIHRTYVGAGKTFAMDFAVGSSGSVDALTFSPLSASSTLFKLLSYDNNCAVMGNNITKQSGGASWDTGRAHSQESFTGGAQMSYRVVNADVFAGLNTDPTNSGTPSYYRIDYAWHCSSSGNTVVTYGGGTPNGYSGTFTVGDILTVTYDNANVRYFQNGTLRNTVAASAGLKLYFDSQIYTVGYHLADVSFSAHGAVGPTGPTGSTGSTGTAGRSAVVFNQDSTPSGMLTGDTWYAPTAKVWKQYNGSTWVQLLGNIASYDAIGASQIAVSELSAISANVGTLRTATTGARTEITANLITIYDSSNVLRVRLGVF